VKILVVDDEADIRVTLRALLERAGYTVIEAEDGREGLRLLLAESADLVLLDVSMPDLDGWDSLRVIRELSDAPVLMLTASARELDKVRGLLAGADDYVTKPFGNQELLARVAALLRRQPPAAPQLQRRAFGELVLDAGARQVLLRGEPVELTRREFDILDVLSRSPRVTIGRRRLLDEVWGAGWYGQDHVIDVHVSNLRRKLVDDPHAPRWIETVRGVGFRFAASAAPPGDRGPTPP
jgi:DNA-binding response OmpR family regulator